ncbi:MAG: deoxynucleoside kinase [Pseudopedobacter saltans]|uniref:Deoxynucleoside kinase n=1 Tax=Pseudopedobacter saltans TaxID=151895 RepID=A0A2W5F2N3_9SPHI|nr:MAG: deoxynucleoside kinase [Pseudopedobacter saltans]
MQYRLITVEGNIGAGKTTLSSILAERLNARLVLESFADNPFLPKFYADPSRYGFQLELFFMAERFKQLQGLQNVELFKQVTVSDYIFIKSLLFAKVTLDEDEYRLYQRLFYTINQQLAQPDILIYLHAPVSKLQQNIKNRNRSYEQSIPDDYLKSIEETYLTYIGQDKIRTLVVDASNADFLRKESHVQTILDALEKDYPIGRHFIELP